MAVGVGVEGGDGVLQIHIRYRIIYCFFKLSLPNFIISLDIFSFFFFFYLEMMFFEPHSEHLVFNPWVASIYFQLCQPLRGTLRNQNFSSVCFVIIKKKKKIKIIGKKKTPKTLWKQIHQKQKRDVYLFWLVKPVLKLARHGGASLNFGWLAVGVCVCVSQSWAFLVCACVCHKKKK